MSTQLTTQPSIQLSANVAMPMVGFGTYLISNDDCRQVVATAINTGYRHIDTAQGYQNEAGVGAAIQSGIASGELRRKDLFLTTKLWPGNAAWGQEPADTVDKVVAACNDSLARLQMDYVDLYLIHAPFTREQRLVQWRGLLELQQQGKARAVGVSNFNQQHIEDIIAAGLPLPAINQIELHPWSQKPELTRYLADKGIVAMAYSSLVPLSSWREVAGQDSAKTEQMRADGLAETSPFKRMAAKYGISESQLLLRWGVQQGFPVIPKSTSPQRMAENLAIFDFEIDAADMQEIATMNRGDGVAWAIGDPSTWGQ